MQRLLSDFARPKQPMPLPPQAAEDRNASRQAELTRLGLPARMAPAKVGRPTLQSLCEGALAAQIHVDPHFVQHIASKKKQPLLMLATQQSMFFENPQQWRQHLRSFDATWDDMLEGARLLHSKGQLFENKKGQDLEEVEENPEEATEAPFPLNLRMKKH
eukprot:115458-Amphidinium_carterae.2